MDDGTFFVLIAAQRQNLSVRSAILIPDTKNRQKETIQSMELESYSGNCIMSPDEMMRKIKRYEDQERVLAKVADENERKRQRQAFAGKNWMETIALCIVAGLLTWQQCQIQGVGRDEYCGRPHRSEHRMESRE